MPPPGVASAAHARVAINSLGPIDNLQIAATGLEPGKKYWVMLVGGAEPQELVTFNAGIAGIGGAAIAQALGPLKRAVAGGARDEVGGETRRQGRSPGASAAISATGRSAGGP
jgi:hypothetical protein